MNDKKTLKKRIIIILFALVMSLSWTFICRNVLVKKSYFFGFFLFNFCCWLLFSYAFASSIKKDNAASSEAKQPVKQSGETPVWPIKKDNAASSKAKPPVKQSEETPVWLKEAFDNWKSEQKDQKPALCPVKIDGQSVHVSLADYLVFYNKNFVEHKAALYQYFGVISLTEKEPLISLYEDSELRCSYRLQTEGDEDFTGKYFQAGVNLYFQGNPAVPVCQIDGFISDTPEKRKMNRGDIAYRMEVCFLGNDDDSKKRYEENRGKDLGWKALKYAGMVTPRNVRLVGICPKCGQSFAFHSYAVYLTQDDAAYSDDGLDVCTITDPNIDKSTWMYEADGKTFRYYNSFCCPYCGEPYIDYKNQPENKKFGVSACVHLGHQLYQAGYEHSKQLSEQDKKPEEMADTGSDNEHGKQFSEPERKPEEKADSGSDNGSDSVELDDLSYIKKMYHQQNGPWHRYSILIDARPAAWITIIDWADYMAEADLDKITTVTYGSPGEKEKEINDQFKKYKKMANIPELQNERSRLAIGGVSRVLHCPVKIVWFNQKRVIKVFTWVDDDKLMERYVETVIRRTFGTADAMKPVMPYNA